MSNQEVYCTATNVAVFWFFFLFPGRKLLQVAEEFALQYHQVGNKEEAGESWALGF